MSERQRQATWDELQRQRATVEAHKSITTLEAQLSDVEQQLGPAIEEEGRRRQVYETAGWRMVQALERRPPTSSLLVLAGDPERTLLDQAEAALSEIVRIVGTLQARRARIRQHLAHLRGVVAA